MIPEIHCALGRITKVTLKATEGIFLDLQLQGYMRGDNSPLMARAKWCPAYAGAGYGDWALPDVGRMVVAHFPLPSPHRASGGDLDQGFAVAYASDSGAPPTDGVDLPLSATTRVLRGKVGVAEQRETHGAFKWFFRSALNMLCDAISTITGVQILIVSSDVKIGSGPFLKLLNTVAMATYNAHTHPNVQNGPGSTGVPSQQMAADTHTTTHLTSS